MRPAELRTARLRLAPLCEPDIEALHQLWTVPAVRRYLWDGHVLGLEQTRDIVMQSTALYAERGYGLWGAFDAEGALIGFCGYWSFRDEHELELLYGVAEPYWLKGYAREMVEPMIAYGFEHLRLSEIRASIDAPNSASLRVLRRQGFLNDSVRNVAGGKLFFRLPRERRETDADGWEAA